MRTLVGGLLLLAVTATGCGGSADTAANASADSAAAMMAVAEPAGISAADIAGTWSGISLPEQGDSIVNRWTLMAGPDNGGRLVLEGSTDTVSYTAEFSGDSAIATSAPYTEPTLPAGSPQMMWRSVGRLVDGKFVGTIAFMSVAAPDSVAMRGRWEATRAP